jgi:hypothetical protein
MKYIWKIKLSLVAFIAIFVFAQTGSAQTNRTAEVRFKRGTTSANYKDKIRGYGGIDYVLGAKAGQKMVVKLKSSNRFIYFNVIDRTTKTALDTDPAPREVTEWEGTLPKTGDYIVQVYLVRAEARRNRTAPFSISIEVSGKGEN